MLSANVNVNRRGAAAIIVVFLFVVSMIFAYFTLNLSNIQRHQAASQISSDLASRWGVDMISRETDLALIDRQLRDLVARNWTLNHDLPDGWVEENENNLDIDIQFGSVRGDLDFRHNQSPINAVRVNSTGFVGLAGAGFASLSNGKSEGQRSQVAIGRSATTAAIERDICLVIDRSGSMNFDLQTGTWSTDNSFYEYNAFAHLSGSYWESRRRLFWRYWPHPNNSRWSTMIPAVYGLAEELKTTRQNELFSIVSYSTRFNGNAYTHFDADKVTQVSELSRHYNNPASAVETEPSFDYDKSVAFLENKYMWDMPVAGGTNISAGIYEAIDVLTGKNARPNAFKTMIVMTDGQYNSGLAPWVASAEAKDKGIEVFTVTFSDQADTAAMRRTAEDGDGKHFHAPDGDALEDIFKEIANIPPKAFVE